MKTSIVARETEIHQLETLMDEELPQFVAVYGRRRVGKTFLIREYFDDDFTFFHTAISPQELKDRHPELLYRIQLDEFGKTLKLYGFQDDSPIKDWFDAFDRLWQLILQHPAEERLVLFIDELPWLDTPRAGFMSALEHFWNRYASGRHKLLFIVAGSSTTWMLDKLINNNGGLYDRTSRDIHIHPFTLSETEAYFQKRGILMDRYDIVQSYMIVGGIPYYLSLFEKGKSLAQNVDTVGCFSPCLQITTNSSGLLNASANTVTVFCVPKSAKSLASETAETFQTSFFLWKSAISSPRFSILESPKGINITN